MEAPSSMRSIRDREYMVRSVPKRVSLAEKELDQEPSGILGSMPSQPPAPRATFGTLPRGKDTQSNLQRLTSTAAAEKDSRLYKRGELLTSNIITYLIRTVKTLRQRTELAVHAFLLLVLCVVLLLTKVEDNTSRPYYVYSAVHDMTLGTIPPTGMTQAYPGDWTDVSSDEQLWKWMDGFVDRLWSANKQFLNSHNEPLSRVLLYQQRVASFPCPSSIGEDALLSTSVLSKLSNTCIASYRGDSGNLASAPFGPLNEYHSNADEHANGQRTYGMSGKIRGEIFTYHDKHKRLYVERLELSEDSVSIKNHLSRLRGDGWFNYETRLVGLDFFTFNKAERYFVRCQVFAEVTGAGEVRPQHHFLPFTMESSELVNGKDYAVLVLDVLLLGLVLVEVVNLVRSLRDNADLEGDWKRAVGMWEVLNILNVALFIVNYYYRFKLLEATTGSAADEDFFEKLSWFADAYNENVTYQAWNVALSWLRLFQYLQYNERLNVVSVTVKQAAGDLMAMVVITLIIVMAYTFMGHLLFGNTCGTFRDIPRSFGTLLRFVYGDGVYSEEYPCMMHAHPIVSNIYVMTFLVIIWLILLNLVLAIITGSFAVVQESLAEPDWSVESLLRDAKSFLRRMLRALLPKRVSVRRKKSMDTLAGLGTEVESDEMQEIPKDGPDDNEVSEGEAVVSVEERSRYINKNEAVLLIQLLKQPTVPKYVTEDDILLLADFLTEEQVGEVIKQARKEFTGKQQMIKMGERLGQNMNMRLIAVEEAANRLLRLEPFVVNGIPQLGSQVASGFETLDKQVLPDINGIKENIKKLSGLSGEVGIVKEGVDKMHNSTTDVSEGIRRLKADLTASLSTQAVNLLDIIEHLSVLQTLPNSHSLLIEHLEKADDLHKQTTEQLLVPLKEGLVELAYEMKVKTGLTLSSQLAETREQQEQQKQEATDVKQHYGNMVTQLFSPASPPGGPPPEGPQELPEVPLQPRSKSLAMSQVLAELKSSSKKPEPMELYAPPSDARRDSPQ